MDGGVLEGAGATKPGKPTRGSASGGPVESRSRCSRIRLATIGSAMRAIEEAGPGPPPARPLPGLARADEGVGVTPLRRRGAVEEGEIVGVQLHFK